ncbi:MAG: hypothetical protein HYT46_00700 [Candidatus Vogelbacteria bacterium]|nr:hypothetical protein [Candidatus Vogelbacteria bacterium]
MKRKTLKKFRSVLKKKLLYLLYAGSVIALSRSSRQRGYVILSIPRMWRKLNRSRLYRIIKEFRRDRLVDYQEDKDGIITVVLTEAGKKRTLAYDVDQIEINKPRRWDGSWHLVFSDIPEKKRAARDALRHKLRELGFHQWQKSVFVYPYPCRDQIDFIVEFFELRPYVRYGELFDPTNEAELKLHFGLE